MEPTTMNAATSRNNRVFPIAALIVFIIAWFLPVYGPDIDNKGYDAYLATYQLIFDLGDKLQYESAISDKLITICISLSPHTNYIIVLSLLVLLLGKPQVIKRVLRLLSALLLVCLVINLIYLYAFRQEIPALRIGYYLWVISFLLAWIATMYYRSPDSVTLN